MKRSKALYLLTPVTIALLAGCAAPTDESELSPTEEVSSPLISGDIDLAAPAPKLEFATPYQSKITAQVKLTGLAPGATGTLTYSLGRQAYRHPYFRRTEVRTVTLEAGATEISDSVSAICNGTRLPYTWYITGTLTTSAGSVEIQGARTGVRCM